MPVRKIEDHRQGYPQYSALLAAYEPYLICRRFVHLRARLLLLKQDRLALLEHELETVDDDETHTLFLGVNRCDKNASRRNLLQEIEDTLTEYDELLEKTNRVLKYKSAPARDVQSLQNWINGTGCIARDETEYLNSDRDLITLTPDEDDTLSQIETWIVSTLVRYRRNFRQSRHFNISTDSNVCIYSGIMIKRTAHMIIVGMLTLLLLGPVAVCSILSSDFARLPIMILSTVLYLIALLLLTKPKTMELMVAGATYATVLNVFISGSIGG